MVIDYWTMIVGEITGKGHEGIFWGPGKVLNVNLGNCDTALFLRIVYFIYLISVLKKLSEPSFGRDTEQWDVSNIAV